MASTNAIVNNPNSNTIAVNIGGIQDHTKLTNIGVNTHAQIDTALTSSVQSVSGATATQVVSDRLIVYDTSSNAGTVDLLAASLWTGKTLNIKKTSALNKVTINPDGSETIEGAATFDFFNDNESITIMSDGTGIHIV